MSDRPSLWWAYDAEDNSFSALPAGPLLLPALFVAVCVSIIGAIHSTFNRPDRLISRELLNSNEYQRKKQRYHELVSKRLDNGELELHEHHELERLKRPYWIKSGTWTY